MPETPSTTGSDYYNTKSKCTFLAFCSIRSTRSRLHQVIHVITTTVALISTQIAPSVEEIYTAQHCLGFYQQKESCVAYVETGTNS